MDLQIEFTEMTIADYKAVLLLWEKLDEVWVNECDTKEKISFYLQRNPGMSVLAKVHGKIIGTLLAGHDGRYGYLHHLAIEEKYRKQGIAKKMVNQSINVLKSLGFENFFLQIFPDNRSGIEFWKHMGWELRDDISLMSFEST